MTILNPSSNEMRIEHLAMFICSNELNSFANTYTIAPTPAEPP